MGCSYFSPFGTLVGFWRGTLVHKYFVKHYFLHDIVYTEFPGHSVVVVRAFFLVKTEQITGLCEERARPLFLCKEMRALPTHILHIGFRTHSFFNIDDYVKFWSLKKTADYYVKF